METLDEREKEIEVLHARREPPPAPSTDFKQIREEHARQLADLNAKIKTLTEEHQVEMAGLRVQIKETCETGIDVEKHN